MLDTENIINRIIPEKLSEIEQRKNVRIIHCVESGSRAWGFPSPDSDFDVRFIYVRPKEYYLKLEQTRDVIEWQLDDTLDINGWDLKKALILLHKSNPTLFEWNNSPIVYRTTDDWKMISDTINSYFHSKSGIYHYLNTAKNNYREYLRGDTVRLKKYFYVLRPVLASKWIIEKQCPPPVLFTELADACLDSEIKPAVDVLLKMKTSTPEFGEGKRIDVINDYLDTQIAEIEESLKTYPNDIEQSWDELNELFLKLI